MSGTAFFLFTILAGSAFAYALLWVIAQWLKADEAAESVERVVRGAVEKLKAAGCHQPSPGCCPEYEEIVSARVTP